MSFTILISIVILVLFALAWGWAWYSRRRIYTGHIAMLCVWDRQLSPDEISLFYDPVNGANALFGRRFKRSYAEESK